MLTLLVSILWIATAIAQDPHALEYVKNHEIRIYQHKSETFDGFSKKYNCKYLVYYEQFEDMENAILREKNLLKQNLFSAPSKK